MRNIIDIETQQALIDEVKRLTYNINPKVWLGIKWLATYIKIRPGELVRIRERDIIMGSGVIIIPPQRKKDQNRLSW